MKRGPVEDLLEPEHLVPDQGAHGHVIEEDNQEECQKRRGFEDVEGHYWMRSEMFFPQ